MYFKFCQKLNQGYYRNQVTHVQFYINVMIIIILLFGFPIIFTQGTAYIKHKDIVYIYNLVVKNNGSAYRSDSATAEYTKFVIEKFPYYKSNKDYVMGGRTALLIQNSTGKYCEFDGRKLFTCLTTRPKTNTMRILAKHDKDNQPLYSQQLIKFRIPNSSIDCSARKNRPFSCTTKDDMEYYTFVLGKDI